MSKKYLLVDSGDKKKLEIVGKWRFVRPAPGAIWPKTLPIEEWEKADAVFDRKDGWHLKSQLPRTWQVQVQGLLLQAEMTSFGHFGFFPEHFALWQKISPHITTGKKILNLFAYTGACTLFAAQKGASVCHLDASKTSVKWARENAALNGLQKAPVRWIVDDVFKFLKREIKRGSVYDGVILDPPSFGRGTRKEVFKIETALPGLLQMVDKLLGKNGCFVALSCHTPGFTPLLLNNLLRSVLHKRKGHVLAEELAVNSENSWPLPAGVCALWEKEPENF